MKTIALPLPTVGEIFKEQIREDVQKSREIITSVKNNLKESLVSLYSVCGDNLTHRWCNDDIKKNKSTTKPKPEPELEPTEEEKEIKKLEKRIKKIKEKQEIEDSINKKRKELKSHESGIENTNRQIADLEEKLEAIKKELIQESFG